MSREIKLVLGDSLEKLKEFSDGTFDAVCTDPPAGITLLGEEWDNFDAPGVIANSDFKAGATGEAHSHGVAGVIASKGVAAARDPFIQFITEVFKEVYRVLKPGGYGVVWALPRTSHWTAMGLENAGFEILDTIEHLYGNGYPKTSNSMKPAHEPWWLIRKPSGMTVAETMEKHGVGVLGIEGCRPFAAEGVQGRHPTNLVITHSEGCERLGTTKVKYQKTVARPPDAKIQTGWGHQRQEGLVRHPTDADGYEEVEKWNCVPGCPAAHLNGMGEGEFSEGGIARFFPAFQPNDPSDFLYQPKVPKAEKHLGTNSLYWKRDPEGRWQEATFTEYAELRKKEDEEKDKTGKAPVLCGKGNLHPTPKSIGLMRWLVRLVTPPNGIVLDCFLGSGTTALAAHHEGVGLVGIEKDPVYFKIANHRLSALQEHLKLVERMSPKSASTPDATDAQAQEKPKEKPEPPPLIPGTKLSPADLAKLVRKATKKR